MSRRVPAVIAAVVAAAVILPAAPAATAPAAAAAAGPVCRVDYRVAAQWTGGFQAELAVTNLSGAAWPSWQVSFDFPAGQRIRQGWHARWTQADATVTVTGPTWAPGLPDGGTARFGMLGTWTGGNPAPAGFLVNGRSCAGEPEPPVIRNPFLGADGYVNPDWSARARAAAAAGGDLGPAMSTVARQPTAVWLDRIAAITAGRGLRGHLDAALAQQAANGRPVVATFVLYNLPNRSCQRAPHGELGVSTVDMNRYRTEYLDPIAAILAEPRYRDLRIAVVVEPDALPGAIFTHNPTTRCIEYQQAGVYLNTIPYALARLHEIPNVYTYLDVTQSNMLGWEQNFSAGVQLVTTAAQRSGAGLASVDGFAVNVADYDPVVEPFLDIDTVVSGQSVRQSRFVDWNDHLEEHTYIDAMYAALVGQGFGAHVGMLVDTSRNGWGGPARPTGPSPATDLNTFVDESKVDRRRYRFTWCNQVGAGIGELPRATPSAHVHAYAWVKPPGESDGHYGGGLDDRTAEPQCDPLQGMPPIGGSHRPTNAMPGAPSRGDWFDAAFTELVRNAHPPLP